jgi:hypothetical protein
MDQPPCERVSGLEVKAVSEELLQLEMVVSSTYSSAAALLHSGTRAKTCAHLGISSGMMMVAESTQDLELVAGTN